MFFCQSSIWLISRTLSEILSLGFIPGSERHFRISLHSVLRGSRVIWWCVHEFWPIIRISKCLRVALPQIKNQTGDIYPWSYSQWLVESEHSSLPTRSFLWTKLYLSLLRNHTELTEVINTWCLERPSSNVHFSWSILLSLITFHIRVL